MSGDGREEGERRRIAVALRWEAPGAPVVVAKGEGPVAEAIVATAAAHDVAIQENPLLATALAAVELDRQIPEVLYKAVAEVISFVLQSSGRMR